MLRLLGRLTGALFLGALIVSGASAQAPVTLMPGVTYGQQVQFTPHGPVAFTVITAPPPTGLYTLGPVLAGNAITGGRATLGQIEQSVATTVNTAGINGDFFSGADNHPNGIVMAGGHMQHGSTPARSSIGFDTSGGIHIGRISFTGTWKGTGQRRPLAGVNQKPKANQIVLFTPAWGASTPEVANGAAVVLEPFPDANVNADLTAQVVGATDGSSTAIPADGAVLVATGSAVAKLEADVPADGQVTVRLILPPSWGAVVSAVGGGPLLVRGGKPVFHTSENFVSSDLTARDARAAVGQLADGKVIMIAVDGGRPGYSVGMTTYELAQTMARLGAVNAAGLAFGNVVTAAFNGRLLNRPRDPAGAKPVKEALLVQYAGVIAAPPSAPAVGKENAASGEQLSYTIVRPSTVAANVIGPDGVSHPLDSGTKQPGTYRFTWTAFDAEGTWHWNVQATDDANHQSTADQTFLYDVTLTDLNVPRSASAKTGLQVGFSLARTAAVTLQIETRTGTVLDVLPAKQLDAGAQSLAWDGTTAAGGTAPPGTYVARVTDTSSVGTVAHTAAFTLRG
jgi:hypothetical protein